MFIDTHAHLNENEILEIEDFFAENFVILAGTNLLDNIENIRLCEKYKNIYSVIGFHPSEVSNLNFDYTKFIKENIKNEKIVGIGEVGIDLYWTKDNLDLQIQVLKKQIELSKKYHKTLLIHSRDSLKEIFDTLISEKIGNLPIVLHCYEGDLEYYDKFVKNFNVMFGVGGTVTFKKNTKMEEFVRKADLNKLLLETDSPYLTPAPYRGKKNSPPNVRLIALKIAEIKEKSLKEIALITKRNAIIQFDLKI